MFPAGRADITVRWLGLSSGIKVRAIEAGPATGPTVFLIHGWACSVFTFHRTIAPLAAAGFRVLASDLKGHGLSDKPVGRGEYTTPAMLAHLHEVLDALAVGQATVLGHSLGGALALALALDSPERVSRLVLLAPVGLGENALLPVVRALTPASLSSVLPYLVRRWTARLVLRVATGDLRGLGRREVDEYWAPTQFPAATLAGRALAHDFDWTPVPAERLATLRPPTLLIVGSRDRLLNPRTAYRTLLAACPSAEVRIVRGAGHVALEERPDEVNDALLRFLAPEVEAAA
jgi:4,5:9,10-diseco-3-hydroxy-5,9,17-trioxoandrosta-1(10),2-diene-4-oate hydrolase